MPISWGRKLFKAKFVMITIIIIIIMIMVTPGLPDVCLFVAIDPTLLPQKGHIHSCIQTKWRPTWRQPHRKTGGEVQ
jgi:hypothetical protein